MSFVAIRGACAASRCAAAHEQPSEYEEGGRRESSQYNMLCAMEQDLLQKDKMQRGGRRKRMRGW